MKEKKKERRRRKSPNKGSSFIFMQKTEYKYEYRGPVKLFGEIINNDWRSVTYAKSRKQALNNLSFQYKRHHHFVPHCKISLVDDYLTCLDQDDFEYYDEGMTKMIKEVDE